MDRSEVNIACGDVVGYPLVWTIRSLVHGSGFGGMSDWGVVVSFLLLSLVVVSG